MHRHAPGLFGWLRARHAAHHGCGTEAGCGPAHHGGASFGFHAAMGDDLGGGAFGVRRPLRFLAHKLDLDDRQVNELAAILNDLKTERAQAAVDDRRTTAALADAVAADAYDEARAKEAAAARVRSAERLRDAVTRALGRIHALLRPDQRGRLAYLIRTGTLVV